MNNCQGISLPFFIWIFIGDEKVSDGEIDRFELNKIVWNKMEIKKKKSFVSGNLYAFFF